jgi:hypothetical protein
MDLQAFKKEVGGKFFSAIFVKKDGTIREINCRLGVKKHLKGGQLSYNPDDFNYLVVFDLDKKEYRTINMDRLVMIKFNGKSIVGNKALLEMLQ